MRTMFSRSALTLLVLSSLVACDPQRAQSRKCFDDIRDQVMNKTATEVESRWGEPDYREPMPPTGERWVWYNYTYLNCKSHPPEERGQVVHLEIIFDSVGAAAGGLRVTDPLSVSYTIPQRATR